MLRQSQDGAEFVVGPLLRSNVSQLANDILVPVPVLTLNYLPDETLPPPGLYPVCACARRRGRIGRRREHCSMAIAMPSALVPNNNWGRRLLTSFATEFESQGGTLLDHRSYTTGIQDFSRTIEDLMGLVRQRPVAISDCAPISAGRCNSILAAGRTLTFIFLAADAAAGRLLKSQLKFHYSGDLPVYSTSSINAMDGRSDSDLNGVMIRRYTVDHRSAKLDPVLARGFRGVLAGRTPPRVDCTRWVTTPTTWWHRCSPLAPASCRR